MLILGIKFAYEIVKVIKGAYHWALTYIFLNTRWKTKIIPQLRQTKKYALCSSSRRISMANDVYTSSGQAGVVLQLWEWDVF